jgi:hypothetical protein
MKGANIKKLSSLFLLGNEYFGWSFGNTPDKLRVFGDRRISAHLPGPITCISGDVHSRQPRKWMRSAHSTHYALCDIWIIFCHANKNLSLQLFPTLTLNFQYAHEEFQHDRVRCGPFGEFGVYDCHPGVPRQPDYFALPGFHRPLHA